MRKGRLEKVKATDREEELLGEERLVAPEGPPDAGVDETICVHVEIRQVELLRSLKQTGVERRRAAVWEGRRGRRRRCDREKGTHTCDPTC